MPLQNSRIAWGLPVPTITTGDSAGPERFGDEDADDLAVESSPSEDEFVDEDPAASGDDEDDELDSMEVDEQDLKVKRKKEANTGKGKQVARKRRAESQAGKTPSGVGKRKHDSMAESEST